MITDPQFNEFLRRLVADQRSQNPLMLSEWEGRFLDSFQRSSRPSLWFTEARRQATDRMWMKHGRELKFPHPLDTVASRPQMQDADPTGCQYLVKDDAGRQQRCNEPATCQEYRRLRYCDMHREAVERAMKRMGKTICFSPFNPPTASSSPAAREANATPSRS